MGIRSLILGLLLFPGVALAQFIPNIEKAAGTGSGVTDHGALTGLGDDDHTQYPLLLGRSGGQTLIGGTGSASDSLTLQAHDQTFDNDNTGRINFGDQLVYDRTLTLDHHPVSFFNVWGHTVWRLGGTYTAQSGGNAGGVTGVLADYTVKYSDSQSLAFSPLFVDQTVLQPTAAVSDIALWNSFASIHNFSPLLATGITATTQNFDTFLSMPQSGIAAGSHASAAGVITNMTDFRASNFFGLDNVGDRITVTNRRGLWVEEVDKHSGGTETNNIGIEIENLSAGGTDISILQQGTNAPSRFQAGFTAGEDQAPSALVEINGFQDDEQLRIVGHTTQTNPIVLIENNAGTDLVTISNAGAATFAGDVTVPADPYDATGWNGVQECAPKDAVRDMREALSLGSGTAIETKTKTANEDVTNSAALQADDHMTGFTLGSTGVYVVTGTLIANVTASAGPDLKISFDVGTSTLNNMNISVTSVAVGSTANEVNLVATADDTSPGEITMASAATHIVRFSGTIDVTNAGTLQLRWAQNSATVSHTTTLQRGSFMSVYKQ